MTGQKPSDYAKTIRDRANDVAYIGVVTGIGLLGLGRVITHLALDGVDSAVDNSILRVARLRRIGTT